MAGVNDLFAQLQCLVSHEARATSVKDSKHQTNDERDPRKALAPHLNVQVATCNMIIGRAVGYYLDPTRRPLSLSALRVPRLALKAEVPQATTEPCANSLEAHLTNSTSSPSHASYSYPSSPSAFKPLAVGGGQHPC
jgi:hypothetical protein